MKKRTSKSSKRKLRAARNHYTNTVDSLTLAKTTVKAANPLVRQMSRWQNFAEMKVIGIFCAISSFALWTASAESPVPHEGKSAESAQLEALAKKIDEQNAKIDALSQEILKLEQQLSHARPGVMIGEAAPAPATAAAPGSICIAFPRRRQHAHCCARRNAHVHRENVQSDRGRFAKSQPHRRRP